MAGFPLGLEEHSHYVLGILSLGKPYRLAAEICCSKEVHYKRGALQALASKLDVSITSSSPQLPSMQEVTEEFHRRMASSLPLSNTRVRYGNASYHITNVEYKESIAMFFPKSGNRHQPESQRQAKRYNGKLL